MKRIIAWFVHNPIAANLLMAVLVVSGLLTLMSIRQEEFPSIDSEIVLISVAYLGATPEEVEEAVCVRIEEAINGTPGIDRFTSMAVEGNCAVTVELIEGTDTTWALSDLDSKVNGIATFPAETERPIVTYLVITSDVLRIAVSGDVGERALKVLAQGMRDDIAGLPGVSQVSVSYVRPYEISIEVSEQALQRHGLSFRVGVPHLSGPVRSSHGCSFGGRLLAPFERGIQRVPAQRGALDPHRERSDTAQCGQLADLIHQRLVQLALAGEECVHGLEQPARAGLIHTQHRIRHHRSRGDGDRTA